MANCGMHVNTSNRTPGHRISELNNWGTLGGDFSVMRNVI
jgi:hypothetical protein